MNDVRAVSVTCCLRGAAANKMRSENETFPAHVRTVLTGCKATVSSSATHQKHDGQINSHKKPHQTNAAFISFISSHLWTSFHINEVAVVCCVVIQFAMAAVWCAQQRLQLNANKTEVLLVVSIHNLTKVVDEDLSHHRPQNNTIFQSCLRLGRLA